MVTSHEDIGFVECSSTAAQRRSPRLYAFLRVQTIGRRLGMRDEFQDSRIKRFPLNSRFLILNGFLVSYEKTWRFSEYLVLI